MNRSSGTTSLRSRWLTSVAPLALALVATCQSPPSGDPAVSQTQPAQAETGPLRLAAPERWQRLNPDGPFLVSPRLSPDGRWVAASGRLGVGLYVVATDGSSGLQTLDVEYRGPRGWSDAPVALHFGHDEVHAWRRGGLEPGSGRRVWERPWDDDLGLCVRSDRRGSWYHHPREGTVAFEPEGASPELVVDFGAWGVVVSPTGRYAVWSTGTLREPRLWLYDV
ncbi:MAG: hypothetical protein JW940_32075, partial [Polyangiaceae bacterium]|nr:hypothetical protein [Polyangiaceae bacterium]